jgi:hypothetical protein
MNVNERKSENLCWVDKKNGRIVARRKKVTKMLVEGKSFFEEAQAGGRIHPADDP